ncbi:MAG: hypothetical protein H0W78_04585 [Planctomycetes bacterium]|nr:hypothetical protein [Planctomycetota bacterium]
MTKVVAIRRKRTVSIRRSDGSGLTIAVQKISMKPSLVKISPKPRI